jgi:BMFP domain-containing protein YqiC
MAEQIKPDGGDWLTSMFDLQSDLAKRAINECNRLRRRVLDLERQLSSGVAADLTAMQDRITQLEQLLAAARASVVEGADHG